MVARRSRPPGRRGSRAVRQEVRARRNARDRRRSSAGRARGGSEAGRPGTSRRRGARHRADRRRADPRACDGPRDLRPRLRPRRRAAAGTPDRRPAVAHPGRADRARDRCHRTADPLPRQRSAGIMLASAAAAYVERYGVLPARRFSLATTNDSGIDVGGGAPGRRRRSWSTFSTCVGATASTSAQRTCCSCPAAGTRTSLSGRRPAAASASTIGSARTSRMASCGMSRSSEQRPATGYRTVPPRRGTALATRTPRSSTWNGTRPWPTSVARWVPG